MSIQRAPIVLTATALGLAATLGFNTHHAQTAAPTTAAATATATPSRSSSSSSTKSSTKTSTSSSKTATSDAISTRYGTVQLKVTVAGGKITNIEAVQLPGNDPKSSSISSYAVPTLTQSALSKQNGSVDAVSGATYTSNGYQSALQSALDKAGFTAAATSSSS